MCVCVYVRVLVRVRARVYVKASAILGALLLNHDSLSLSFCLSLVLSPTTLVWLPVWKTRRNYAVNLIISLLYGSGPKVCVVLASV